MADEDVKIDELVQDYVRIRDTLESKRKEFKELESKAKAAMNRIEMRLLQRADALGVQNFKTKFGTAFVTEKDFARVAGPEGWVKLVEFMKKTNDFDLVEKRVAKLHFKEVMNERAISPDEMGVEYVIERTIQVRRS